MSREDETKTQVPYIQNASSLVLIIDLLGPINYCQMEDVGRF